jgi:hypothetical protein
LVRIFYIKETKGNNMPEITKEEANKIISEKMVEVKKLISECEQLANDHELEFNSPTDGVYGMGGYYKGQKPTSNDDTSVGWHSSSENC